MSITKSNTLSYGSLIVLNMKSANKGSEAE